MQGEEFPCQHQLQVIIDGLAEMNFEICPPAFGHLIYPTVQYMISFCEASSKILCTCPPYRTLWIN